MFKPSEVVHLTNSEGTIKSEIIYTGNIHASELPNQARQLYLRERTNFYESLLGQYVLVPEGQWDWQWLRLWIRLAEATAAEEQPLESIKPEWSLSALEIVLTKNSAVLEYLKELRRFRTDVVVLIDGDSEGNSKLQDISLMDDTSKPKAVIQFGPEGEIEDVAAWVMEPLLSTPGPILKGILADIPPPPTAQALGKKFKLSDYKGDWELHENLAWEAYGDPRCRARVVAFLSDIARICAGGRPELPDWKSSTVSRGIIPLHVASFISNTAL